jgi:hypothetical protein
VALIVDVPLTPSGLALSGLYAKLESVFIDNVKKDVTLKLALYATEAAASNEGTPAIERLTITYNGVAKTNVLQKQLHELTEEETNSGKPIKELLAPVEVTIEPTAIEAAAYGHCKNLISKLYELIKHENIDGTDINVALTAAVDHFNTTPETTTETQESKIDAAPAVDRHTALQNPSH